VLPRDERAGPLTPYTPAFGQRDTDVGPSADPDHELGPADSPTENPSRERADLMAIPRSFSTAARPAPAAPAAPAQSARHRLRAVDRDEVVEIADFLPPGATWLPAPPHTLPALPGRPPMVGYLVLVPADQFPADQFPADRFPAGRPPAGGQPPLPPTAVPDRPGAPAPGSTAPGSTAAGNAAPPAAPAEPLVRVDAVRRTAAVEGRELDLTYLEFELLAHLVTHPHRVHTRDQLVTTVWGYDVHIARLRRKLGTEHRRTIQTVRRVGYKYTPPTGR
jgi:hypothetical protein